MKLGRRLKSSFIQFLPPLIILSHSTYTDKYMVLTVLWKLMLLGNELLRRCIFM